MLQGVDEVAGGVQTTAEVTLELEGSERPACVAVCLARYYL